MTARRPSLGLLRANMAMRVAASVAKLQDRQHSARSSQCEGRGGDCQSGYRHLWLCSWSGPEISAHAYDYRAVRRYSKALLRILIADLRVNSRAEILPTYRVGAPVVCAQTSSVELVGLEPTTSCMPCKRSSS
jgi:hypothetical protein